MRRAAPEGERARSALLAPLPRAALRTLPPEDWGILARAGPIIHRGEVALKQNLAAGWHQWKALSDRAVNFQARVLLTIFYYTAMAPFGLWQGLVADRLGLRRPAGDSFWLERAAGGRTLDDARRQF